MEPVPSVAAPNRRAHPLTRRRPEFWNRFQRPGCLLPPPTRVVNKVDDRVGAVRYSLEAVRGAAVLSRTTSVIEYCTMVRSFAALISVNKRRQASRPISRMGWAIVV